MMNIKESLKIKIQKKKNVVIWKDWIDVQYKDRTGLAHMIRE